MSENTKLKTVGEIPLTLSFFQKLAESSHKSEINKSKNASYVLESNLNKYPADYLRVPTLNNEAVMHVVRPAQ
jgi:flagellar capping protein FliD